MALKILQPGVQPLGQFDIVDGYMTVVKGGEIGTLTTASKTNSSGEKASQDVLDGYVNDGGTIKRAAVTLFLSSVTRPLWLVDDGISGYGTLFGQVIGSTAGLSTSGTNLGPHTSTGSGKVTCWDKPGLYAVTLDAVDTSYIVPTNATLTPGDPLYPLATGVLTSDVGSSIGAVVGRFVEFETTARSLVRTPASLVGATEAIEHAVFSYFVE